ncbi:hypothetical protein FHL15_007014 [Xylaria flabelliformis]|uniref:Uncharacterized protein n=1 Tax=Xylaria flabelliformis TaxID=2512241 RepID=A0A553HW36_9PEZI|nr:hypothetical protein FHL15_007014 [Xylaria flabelliformis]
MFRRSSSSSISSIESYTSVLSDNSYLKTLKPTDNQFQEILSYVRIIESHRTVLRERKIQSHEAKKRDPNDTDQRKWTDQMDADYASYKAKVDVLSAAKHVQEALETVAKQSKKADISIQEKARKIALEDGKKWLDAAIAASTARLGFMTRYPNALNTPSTKSHIKAIEDNLNSAKRAVREIETQKQKISEAREMAIRQSASSSRHK